LIVILQLTHIEIKTSPLPSVIQADILQVPTVEKPLFKRTLADVKFQMAEQDNLVDEDADKEVVSMLNLSGNSDLIKGVYEGGFKTWECSIDMVQYLSGLPQDQISNKKVLEVSAFFFLPSDTPGLLIAMIAWLWFFSSFLVSFIT
jgi:protein-histidine N-methyltransferase